MNHLEVQLMVSSRVVDSKVYTKNGHLFSLSIAYDEKAKWWM